MRASPAVACIPFYFGFKFPDFDKICFRCHFHSFQAFLRFRKFENSRIRDFCSRKERYGTELHGVARVWPSGRAKRIIGEVWPISELAGLKAEPQIARAARTNNVHKRVKGT